MQTADRPNNVVDSVNNEFIFSIEPSVKKGGEGGEGGEEGSVKVYPEALT